MSKNFKKSLALILTVVMCLGMMPATAFATDSGQSAKKITYVALGDSMAQGYMFTDYNEVATGNPATNHYCGWQGSSENGYIKKFAKDLKEDFGEVDLRDLTVQGLQPDEVYAFLKPETFDFNSMTVGAKKHIGWWVGDLHTDAEQNPGDDGEGKYHIFDTFKDMSDYYIDSIKKADVITYDIGMNYFGTYLTDIRGEDEVFTKLMKDSCYKNQIEKVRKELSDYMKANGLGNVENRIEGILYAYASYLYYTDKCIDAIYDLNPDVEIILIPLSNPHRDLYVEINGIKLSYSKVIDIMMESLNLYMSTINKNHNRYTIAKLDGPVISFADELYYYPDSLSEDAKAMLGKTVLGYSGILGYEDRAVPDEIQKLYTELAIYGPQANQAMSMLADKIDASGAVIKNGLVFDHMVYDYIAQKYGKDQAFNDFYGKNFVNWFWNVLFGSPISLDSGLVDDTNTYKDTIMYCSATIHDYNVDRARAAIAAGTAKEWQEHIIEAINAILFNWEDLCLKAATYRTFPINYLSGDLAASGELTVEDMIRLLDDPDSATKAELTALHAAIRNGQAARGFGAHPCPRGLDVKYRAVVKAYDNCVRAKLADKAIKPADGTCCMKSNMVTLSTYVEKYNPFGKTPEPAVIVKVNGKVLKGQNISDVDAAANEGYDYTYKIENSQKVGKAIVTVKGIGDYTGTVVKYYYVKGVVTPDTITDKGQPGTYNVNVIGDNFIYNGQQIRPLVCVKYDSLVVNPKDYTVSYANNVNVGAATVTVTSKTQVQARGEAPSKTSKFTGTAKFQIAERTLYVIPDSYTKKLTSDASTLTLSANAYGYLPGDKGKVETYVNEKLTYNIVDDTSVVKATGKTVDLKKETSQLKPGVYQIKVAETPDLANYKINTDAYGKLVILYDNGAVPKSDFKGTGNTLIDTINKALQNAANAVEDAIKDKISDLPDVKVIDRIEKAVDRAQNLWENIHDKLHPEGCTCEACVQ